MLLLLMLHLLLLLLMLHLLLLLSEVSTYMSYFIYLLI
jgi:hypothetical protein